MKHYKSVFENEQELLKAIIDIHIPCKRIQLDPMYFKGAFYKNGISQPNYKYDIKPRVLFCKQGDARNLPLESESIESMILDPLFLFGLHGKTKEYYTSSTMGIYKDFQELKTDYQLFLKEAHRLLKKGGILIFKCQDYTDNKTTMTHALVFNWAIGQRFYAKDIAILVKPNKVFNGNLKQRHLRKIHTYFWVFKK
jgi:tRNA G10  N-methylase Trm11